MYTLGKHKIYATHKDIDERQLLLCMP